MRPREQRGAWLVEADVPGCADAEQQQVDSTRLGDGALEPRAFRVEIFCGAVENVHVAGSDVDAAEQVPIHERVETSSILRRQPDELVEVERMRARKIRTQPHQFLIYRHRSSSRWQAEHAGRVRRELTRDETRHRT